MKFSPAIAAALAPGQFFDIEQHAFEHRALFLRPGVRTVIDALDQIEPYCHETLAALSQDAAACNVSHTNWPNAVCEGAFRIHLAPTARFQPDRIIGGAGNHSICVQADAQVRGGVIDVRGGGIALGPGTVVEGAWLSGPALIGARTTVRPGAYLRGPVILGRKVTVRGELKNAVIMDDSDFPHPSYLGDSICGYKTHFGNQATAANVNIFGRRASIKIKIGGETVDLGRRKVGIIMGDYAQLGCNAVSDPGTLLRPRTIVYALTRVNSGLYGPNEVLKNKPMEHGVIERVPLRNDS